MQSWGDLIVLHRGQLLGTVPRMTKESDVEAGGFCILMIYLALLLFSRPLHRYNVSITKALLTLTIWPSDPRCSQSHSLDSGHRCRTCHSARTLNFVSLRERKRREGGSGGKKRENRPVLLIRPGLGEHTDRWPYKSNAMPCLQGENRPPVKWLTTFKEFLTLRWWASLRELLTSEMNSELCLGGGGGGEGHWLVALLTSLTNGNVCLENFWPGRVKELHRWCLRAKLIVHSGD